MIELKEHHDKSPWEIEELTQRAKLYFAPYSGISRKWSERTRDGSRVTRCFSCGSFARVSGVTFTQMQCGVCGAYAYQLNDNAPVHAFVSNTTRKDGKLIELNLTSNIEYDELSINVDFNDKIDRCWLNLLLS